MSFKIELSQSQEERALRLHREAIVVDTHSDTLMQLIPQARGAAITPTGGPTTPQARGATTPPAGGARRQGPRKLGERSETGKIDVPRLIEGGVTCQAFGMYTASIPDNPMALKTSLQMVDAFYTGIEENKDKIVQVRDYDEILKAKQSGKVGCMLTIEGAEPLMGDLGILRVFHRLGVRILSFTHNYRTEFADGLSAARTGGKLTPKGLEAMEEMRRLGIVLDASHITDACFWDVVENTKVPFIASHSNSRELCNVSRNLTDDMLRALAEKGGVTGMNYLGGFVVPREKTMAGYQTTVEDLVDHIDHIVKVVGPDYVGLGSDFDGGGGMVGLEDTSKVPNITRILVKRGYSDEDIKKILGGNHLRVFKQVIK